MPSPNDKYVGGKNRSQQSLRGLADLYKKLHPHQLAIFHSIPLGEAVKLHAAIQQGAGFSIDPSKFYLEVIAYGGKGSGKSFGVAVKHAGAVITIPDNQVIVARKRHEQLRNTYYLEFLKVIEIATDGKPEYLILEDKDRDGAVEVLTVTPGKPSLSIFRIEPEGEPAAVVDSWKSYNAGGVVLEEVSQLKGETRQELRDRLRRVGISPLWMVSALNPITRRHWMYKVKHNAQMAEINGRPSDVIVVVSETKDNKAYLPQNYEATIRNTYADQPWKIAAMLEGKDDVDMDGKPVFGAVWDDKNHIDRALEYNPYKPMIRGWDFGYHHPACVFMQEDDKGCLNVLHEELGEDLLADQFGRHILSVSQQMFPLAREWKDYGDPACAQQTDKGDTTLLILIKLGIRMQFRVTKIDPGIRAIRKLLVQHRNRRPELVFHPRCADLITAFRYGYHYAVNRHDQIAENPFKDGIYDHLVDALRYAVVMLRPLPKDADEEMEAFGGALTSPAPDRWEA